MEQAPSDTRPTLPHYLFSFAVVVVLWFLLVGKLSREELVAAVVVGVLVTVIAGPRLAVFSAVKLKPAALGHIWGYFAHLFPALIRANLDVARRVLDPSLPIRPAVVEVRTKLTSPFGKMLLANSITLTPGTLTIDVIDDRLLVHWIDCTPGDDMARATRVIAEGFERHISGFLK